MRQMYQRPERHVRCQLLAARVFLPSAFWPGRQDVDQPKSCQRHGHLRTLAHTLAQGQSSASVCRTLTVEHALPCNRTRLSRWCRAGINVGTETGQPRRRILGRMRRACTFIIICQCKRMMAMNLIAFRYDGVPITFRSAAAACIWLVILKPKTQATYHSPMYEFCYNLQTQ